MDNKTIIGLHLLECIAYNPENGKVQWTRRLGPRAMPGQEVGTRSTKGYLRVKHKGTNYALHRIIWALHTGTEPPEFVDHKNGNASDNRWCNLREATSAQNNTNRKCRGYYYETRSGLWVVQLKINGVQHRRYLHTEAEAAESAITLREQLMPDWHRCGA